MAGYAYFERVNSKQNAYRAYRYVIRTGHSGNEKILSASWGRIGSERKPEDIFTGQAREAWRKLISCSRQRLKRGYRLKEFSGPQEVRQELDRLKLGLGRLRPEGQRGNALFYDLPKIEALFRGHSAEREVALRLEALRDLLDPGFKSPRRANREQLALPGLDYEDDVSGHVRSILSLFAEELLTEDPRTRSAVRRVLGTPRRQAGSNLVYLVPSTNVLNIPILQAFRENASLSQLAYRLSDDGISTLGQLVRLSRANLSSTYALTPDELEQIDRICGEFGLLLEMEDIRELTADRRAI